MNTSFDTKLDRSGGISWLKDLFTPDQVRQAGLLSFAGAEFEFATCPALIKAVQEAAGRGAVFQLQQELYPGGIHRGGDMDVQRADLPRL